MTRKRVWEAGLIHCRELYLEPERRGRGREFDREVCSQGRDFDRACDVLTQFPVNFLLIQAFDDEATTHLC